MLTVLIVDDSRLARAAIKKVVNQATQNTAHVLEAANGRLAMAVMQQQAVQVVFTGINMPVMDGAALLRAMREAGLSGRTRVIVVTADDSAKRLEYMKREGVRAYLRKPFRATDVRNALQQAIQGETADFFADRVGAISVTRHDLRQAFLSILTDVVGRFSFGYVDRADPAFTQGCIDQQVSATVAFAAPSPGRIEMAAPLSLCRTLAHAVLRTAQECIDQDDAEDALRELLNITCGRTVAAFFGNRDQPMLGIPTSCLIDDWAWEGMSQSPHTLIYAVEDKPLMLTFTADEL